MVIKKWQILFQCPLSFFRMTFGPYHNQKPVTVKVSNDTPMIEV